MKIKKISLDPTTNQLSIEYKNDQISNWSPDDFPNEWGRFLKQEVSRNPVYLNQSTNRDDQNRWPVGEIAVGASIVIGLFSVIGILVYRWNKKK